MTKSQYRKPKRINIYLEESDYNKLRAILILRGMTVSEWVRLVIKSFLRKNTLEESYIGKEV